MLLHSARNALANARTYVFTLDACTDTIALDALADVLALKALYVGADQQYCVLLQFRDRVL